MDKWEYRTFIFVYAKGLRMREIAEDGSLSAPAAPERASGLPVPSTLNKIGEEGWELATSAISGSYLIFKRRKP